LSEAAIQNEILEFLRKHPKVAFAIVNTCGTVQVKKRWITLGYPGLPDITGMLRNGLFFGIEVKTKKGQPSDLQKDFITVVNSYGGKAGIARSIEDAIEIIEG